MIVQVFDSVRKLSKRLPPNEGCIWVMRVSYVYQLLAVSSEFLYRNLGEKKPSKNVAG